MKETFKTKLTKNIRRNVCFLALIQQQKHLSSDRCFFVTCFCSPADTVSVTESKYIFKLMKEDFKFKTLSTENTLSDGFKDRQTMWHKRSDTVSGGVMILNTAGHGM